MLGYGYSTHYYGAPPNCGERYAEQYVSNDCGMWCTPNEVGTALGRLRNLQAAVLSVWNNTIQIENANGTWPFWEVWYQPYANWLARDQFPTEYALWEAAKYDEGETFARIRDVARDGVCLLDQMVAHANQLYGKQNPHIETTPPPYTPPPPEPLIPGAGGLFEGLGVGIIALAVLAFMAFSGGRR